MGGATNGNAKHGFVTREVFAREKSVIARCECASTHHKRGGDHRDPSAILDPHGIYPVVLKNPIGDYIRGGAAARRAFFAVANRAFQDYGLNLKPGNLANVKTVQDLVDVIADGLRRRGYQVT